MHILLHALQQNYVTLTNDQITLLHSCCDVCMHERAAAASKPRTVHWNEAQSER
jgi:hypothetical protein